MNTPHAEQTTPAIMPPSSRWLFGVLLAVLTYGLAFGLRMMEWPSWQEVEFRLGQEMLLGTHDAYHWVAGAEGFEFGTGHPMSELLRIIASLTGYDAAAVAFWLPPIMASLVACFVFAWAWSMGSMEAGVCAGVLASLAPGFLARTLFGYADTDLVTLVLPLAMGLVPACWVMRFLNHPMALPFQWCRKRPPVALTAPRHARRGLLGAGWALGLGLSGLLGWWGQEWHSMFPYLVRYNVALFGGMALLLPLPGERRAALLMALVYALPTLVGPWGCLPALVIMVLRTLWHVDRLRGLARNGLGLLTHPAVLVVLWGAALFFLVDAEVFTTLTNHVQSYLKRGGDAVEGAVADPLVFPSVAQSIIEVQDLSFTELLVYFHPWPWVAVLGLVGFGVVLWARSGALFLLPLALLALSSMKLGGRMVMFGAPVVALGLTLPVDWLACSLGDVRARHLRVYALLGLVAVLVGLAAMPDQAAEVWKIWMALGPFRPVAVGCAVLMLFIGMGRVRGWLPALRLDALGPHLLYRGAAVTLMLIMIIPPLAELIPAMTHGPILNRRHAAALRAVRTATPEDAMLWVWWDWGYAAHHFARRKTIADGAAHGGPSLYLPAAVFATDDPRFARQLIKYTALVGNEPGNVFKDMTGAAAAALVARLKNPETPLIVAPGKQYVAVSFDMLDLGFWISNFGTWDFTAKAGRGYAISIVPQQLAYRIDKGEVLMQSTNSSIPAASIDLFEDGRLVHKDYVSPPTEPLPNAAAEKTWRDDVERRRNVHFLFNRVTNEKLVVDDTMYNTLMVQLLVSAPNDPRFAPYFRLIYDNVFCRVYEVL